MSQGEACFSSTGTSCCRLESVVGVDERGQMVLPKELRRRAGIRAGDKMAVIAWEQDGEVCCLSLVRAERLTGMVQTLLGPMMSELAGG